MPRVAHSVRNFWRTDPSALTAEGRERRECMRYNSERTRTERCERTCARCGGALNGRGMPVAHGGEWCVPCAVRTP